MPIFYTLRILLVLFFSLQMSAAFAENTGTIKVHVYRLNNNKGVVRASLFKTAESYKADKNTAADAYKKEVGKIENQQSDFAFADIPYGDYAIKLYHDEDNSGKFIKNFMRVPCVQFGFSNNAKAILGPPDFKKAKFSLAASELKMDIKMDQR